MGVERGRSVKRGGLWFLCLLAIGTTGIASLGAFLASGYTHEGEAPFSTVGAIGQFMFAVAGFAAAIAALLSLTGDKPRRAFLLALTALAITVG